jgi:hypothetical protein
MDILYLFDTTSEIMLTSVSQHTQWHTNPYKYWHIILPCPNRKIKETCKFQENMNKKTKRHSTEREKLKGSKKSPNITSVKKYMCVHVHTHLCMYACMYTFMHRKIQTSPICQKKYAVVKSSLGESKVYWKRAAYSKTLYPPKLLFTNHIIFQLNLIKR